MSLDLRRIRFAQAVSQHGSFSRAAEALKIAQPTLSRSIKELEDEFGLKLFTRNRYGVEPTDFGYVFLQQAAMVVAQVAELDREIALARGQRRAELAIGFGPYAADILIPRCMPYLVSAPAAVRLRIDVEDVETLGRLLRARSLDLIVGEVSMLKDDDSVEVVATLPPIRAYIVGRSGHPLASRPGTMMADVLEYPLVQVKRLPPRMMKPLLAARRRPVGRSRTSIPPFPAVECPSVPVGVNAITCSDALMISSLVPLQRELEARQVVPVLHESWMHSDWAIMRARRSTLAPAAAAFVVELQRAHETARADDARLGQWWTAGAPSTSKLRNARGGLQRT